MYVGIPLISLTSSHFRAWPKPRSRFPTSYFVVGVFVFRELRCEVVVLFHWYWCNCWLSLFKPFFHNCVTFFFNYREFGISCSRCNVTIQKDDWIRKAHGNCYHLSCFNCDICKRQLPTGEQFAFHNNILLCKIHYLQVLNAGKLGKGKKTSLFLN